MPELSNETYDFIERSNSAGKITIQYQQPVITEVIRPIPTPEAPVPVVDPNNGKKVIIKCKNCQVHIGVANYTGLDTDVVSLFCDTCKRELQGTRMKYSSKDTFVHRPFKAEEIKKFEDYIAVLYPQQPIIIEA